MRKIFILGLFVIMSVVVLSDKAVYANCGTCGVGAVTIEEKSTVEITGEIICLGCTLKKEQTANAQCSVYGHTNGLRTSDGRIWTFLENDASTKLINDHALAGKSVEIKGKQYQNANYIEVEEYKIL